MKRFSLLFVLLALSAVFAAAQEQNQTSPDSHEPRPRRMGEGFGRPGGLPGLPGLGADWWRNSEVAQSINLTEAQQKQLNDIFTSHRGNLVTLRGNVEAEEKKFHSLLEQQPPQQDQVLAEMTQLQIARNTMEKEFTVMSLSFRSVLTPDQWKKLQELTKERMGRRFGMHEPHGPRPEGPPPQEEE